MIKNILLLLNTFAVIFYNLFFGNGVTVTARVPSSASPGSTIPSEVIIEKGDVGGFAKLQIELPVGLSVKEIDSKGASFNFTGQTLKLIWTSLPTDKSFSVKFDLIADASVSGIKKLEGKFSYLENNAKQQAVLEPASIDFSGAGLVVNTPENQVSNENPTTNTVTPVSNTEEPTSFSPPQDPNAPVSAVRRVTYNGDNNYTVDVKIKKDGIKGFAKLTDKVPSGYIAEAISTNGAVFKYEDHKAKFIWASLPIDEDLIISYKLIFQEKPTIDSLVTGNFSFLENEQTKTVKINEDVEIHFKNIAPQVVENPITTNTVNPVTNETTNPATVTPTNTVVPTNTVIATNTVSPETTNTNPPENKNMFNASVSFRIQIGAYLNKISTSQISNLYNIKEKIVSEMADYLTKFMVGNFQEYKEAREHRETMRNKGVNDAFVTAYNSGKRITVQEALMITNQKWFK